MGRDVELETCGDCGSAVMDTPRARRLHRDWHTRVVTTRAAAAPPRFVGQGEDETVDV